MKAFNCLTRYLCPVPGLFCVPGIAIKQALAFFVLAGRDLTVRQVALQHFVGRLARASVPPARTPPAVEHDDADQRQPEDPPEKVHAAHEEAAVVNHVHSLSPWLPG